MASNIVFHPSLIAFLFDRWTKRREIAEEVSMNCTAFTYYVMLMAKRTCAWLHHPLKLLPLSTLLSCTDSSHQDGFMLRLICMFLGCDMPIQLVLSSEYYDRLPYTWNFSRYVNFTDFAVSRAAVKIYSVKISPPRIIIRIRNMWICSVNKSVNGSDPCSNLHFY